MKLKITHRDTGLTLRQYARKYDVQVPGSDRPIDCRENRISYMQTEDGLPAFERHATMFYECDGGTYVLDPSEWVICHGF